jgi:hypothetical protein
MRRAAPTACSSGGISKMRALALFPHQRPVHHSRQ